MHSILSKALAVSNDKIAILPILLVGTWVEEYPPNIQSCGPNRNEARLIRVNNIFNNFRKMVGKYLHKKFDSRVLRSIMKSQSSHR